LKLIGTLLEADNNFNNFNNFNNKNKTRSKTSLSLDIIHLQKKWSFITGKGFLSGHTAPFKFKNKELFIVTNMESLLEQAPFMKTIIMKKIKGEFAKEAKLIRGIQFIFDKALFIQQKEIIQRLFSKKNNKSYFHPFSPEFKSLRAQADNEFNFIDDLEIKKCLVSLFIQQGCSEQ
jgi:hypothetical protein